ncbi:MAG: right-handed parallel beta-helix repeat-containing protein [Phycisphaerales bacterium]
MGFSSIVEPNDVGFDYFEDEDETMELAIRNRNLNGNTSMDDDEIAGAMMWYLPDLAPGQSTSITLALMYGSNTWPFPTLLTKINADPNNDCVRPFIGMGIEDNYLTYDICYDANGYPLEDVNIIDYLPIEVDYYSSDPGGIYDPNSHTVTWNIGDLSETDSNCIELVTKVNYYAKPGGKFSNFVQMQCSEGVSAATVTDVNVCYDGYGMGIIYVDKDANGYNNGRSWDDAYTDLRDAFTGASSEDAAVTAIWVAEGIYKPVYDTNDSSYKNESFNLIEDVGIFGHFGGVGTYETSTSQRDFSDANNTTILEGQIGEDSDDAVKYIIKAEDIDDGLVDGFTIQGSYGTNAAGIFLDGSDISVLNCKFKGNDDYGIHATDYSYPDIHNCLFLDNTKRDIYADTSQPDISYCTMDGNDISDYGVYLNNGSTSNISNSIIKDHTGDGIYGSNATVSITDSVISDSSDNGIEGSNSYLFLEKSIIEMCTDNGINLSSYSYLDIKRSVVRKNGERGIYLSQNSGTSIINNWIHNNGKDQISDRASGLYFYNQVGIPLVRNNTIYANYTYGIESSENGADPNVINCIIYGNDSNDFYRENGTFDTVNYCNLANFHAGTGNITGDPGFKNIATAPNDLHIDEISQCKDAGDPNGSYNESDIDGENRIYYGRVDIGADEYYFSLADFDEGGFVNFRDYAILAAAWQTDSGDDNYNEDCDLEDNNSIDVNDLALFCEDWLWEKGWEDAWMMTMGGGGGSTLKSMGGKFSLFSLKSASVAEKSDILMLSAAESLRTRPERLAAKSQKFYNITPQSVAESKAAKPKPLTERELYELHMELLKWLDEIWESGELDESMTETEYLEFRKALLNGN